MHDIIRQKPILRNWQAMIYHKIDTSRLDAPKVVRELEEEIDKCYCFEFANDEEYINMLDYLETSVKAYVIQVKLLHEKRMIEIQENQRKMLEQKEAAKLLEQADREFYKRFGRIKKK